VKSVRLDWPGFAQRQAVSVNSMFRKNLGEKKENEENFVPFKKWGHLKHFSFR
jgi:hypothetical protein